MRNFRQELVALLSNETKLKPEEVDALLTIPPDSKLGDFAFPCFKLGKNPKDEAEKLNKKLSEKLNDKSHKPDFISKIVVVNAYLNFFLEPVILCQEALTEIFTQRKFYGKSDIGKDKKVVLDFSAPNIAKPFGIGHLRSTVIGNCLRNLLSFLGYKTIAINHLGDWGTQFGKLIVAYKKWGDEKELEKDPIKYLLSIYVKFHQEAEKDPTLDEEARHSFKLLEDGNAEFLALWELFKDLTLREFKRIYNILDIEFDSYQGEAFYNNLMDEAIKKLQEKVPTEISDGALIVNLEKYKLPPLLLRKSDGATTYHSRDLAAIFYRLQKYRADKIIYVVGSEQKLHFQQLFKTAELYGVPAEKLVHVDFGLFLFPEGKMSTREGKVIFLEDVLNKSIDLAKNIIAEKNPNLGNSEEIAKEVGVGAIIFADLSNDRIRNIDFDWNRMLSFDGETGPYLQYTHARACSILRKALEEQKLGSSDKVNFSLLESTEEQALVKKLYQFSDVLVAAAHSYRPHILANYLIALAQSFNGFYHNHTVISDDKGVMKVRLLLVDCTRQVLENGLHLLGIKSPKEM
ncbi:arginine--tRNA ligase [Candidatus Woesearchaeota archaeon]|nr:arginine--tRNA ligase [Candidatus Woesearchaeota archaeon]